MSAERTKNSESLVIEFGSHSVLFVRLLAINLGWACIKGMIQHMEKALRDRGSMEPKMWKATGHFLENGCCPSLTSPTRHAAHGRTSWPGGRNMWSWKMHDRMPQKIEEPLCCALCQSSCAVHAQGRKKCNVVCSRYSVAPHLMALESDLSWS